MANFLQTFDVISDGIDYAIVVEAAWTPGTRSLEQ